MLSPTAARQCWRGTPACRHGPHILAPRSTNLQGSPSYIGPQLVGRLWTPVTLACPRLSRTLSRCQAATVGAAAVAQEPEVLSCTQYLGDASIWVIVSKGDGDYQVEVIADQPRPNLVLHWAVDGWELPPEQAWPPGTRKVGDGGAVQSPFEFGQLVTLTFPEAMCPSRLVFVLRDGDQWIHNRGGDFSADLKPSSIEEVVLYTAPPPPALPQPELLAHTRYDAGVSVVVDRNNGVYQLEVAADKPRKGLVLHWAIEDWQLPPQAAWPPGTTKAGEGAVQTPFQRGEYVTLTFPESVCPSKVVFVLKDGSKWVKNHGQDFSAALKPPTPESQGLEVLSYTHHEAGLSTVVGKGSGSYLVEVVADHPRPELVMHWAVEDWRLPARGVWPPGTVQAGDGAVQTPFQGGQSIKLLFPQDTCPSKLVFVLKEGEQWLNDNGADFTARLTPGSHTADPPPAHNQQHHHHNNNNQHYAALEEEPEVISCTNFEAGILVVVGRVEGAFMVVVMSDQPRQDMVLHWAVEDWQLPQKKVWPPNSTQAGDAAVQTPFREGSQSVAIAFPESLCPSKVVFVLKEGERWITDGGKDFAADLRPALSQGNHAHEALSNGHLDAGFWGGSNGNGAGRHANGANGNGRHYSNWAAQVAH